MIAGRALLTVALAVALLLGAAGVGEAKESADVPEVGATAWVLVDVESGRYLDGENADERLSMGSTDKMMVAFVALDAVATGEVGLEEPVVVSEEAASYAVPAYSNVGLREGDVLAVRELLLAALISSGNDASWALAEHLGGGGRAGVERFVGMMNERTRTLGLEDTRFRNPTGLDARGQHSTARDLAEIARAGFDHPLFREAVSTTYATVSTEDRKVELATTNELLSAYPAATGVKTGYTPGAGPCLVASAAKGDEAYVSVVLGDEERFGDSRRLLEHGFAAYDRAVLVEEGERYARIEVPYRRNEELELTVASNVEAVVREGSRIEREVKVIGDLPDSADPGAKLGEVVVRVDGKSVGDGPLLTRRGYDEATPWDRAWYALEGIWSGA